jgi:putative transposase
MATTFQQRFFPTCYGLEFISRDLDLWAYADDVTLDFSRPGKPTDNAFIEAFNSKFRAECPNAHWFMSLADAREKLEDWPLSTDCGAIACRAMAETTPRSGRTARSATNPDRPAKSRWPNQRVVEIRAGKFQLPAAQGWGSGQERRILPIHGGKSGLRSRASSRWR